MTQPLGRRALLGLAAAAMTPMGGLHAQALSAQQVLVDDATLTVRSMLADTNLPDVAPFIRAAHGIFIVPELIRGGFIIGGQGGTGVLLSRGASGIWGYPAFMDLAAGSVGLQIGGQVGNMLMTIMTQTGIASFLESGITLGANASVAAITAGIGIEARTGLALDADMYAFMRAEGLYLGGAIEGSFVSENAGWNAAYYGPDATAEAILNGRFINAGADRLRGSLICGPPKGPWSCQPPIPRSAQR